MNKLKQNLFWAVCGALGAVLVIIFAVVVFPLWAERDAKQVQVIAQKRVLTNAAASVASKGDIDAWNARKKEYIEDYKAIADAYVQRDADLERWLDKLGMAVSQFPRPDQFINPYQDAGKELEAKLAKINVGVGMVEPPREEGQEPKVHFGFNWEQISTSDVDWQRVTPADQNAVVRLVQKRYWIAEHIANACSHVEEGRTVTDVKRILDLRFFRYLHDDTQNFKPPEMRSQGAAGLRVPEYIPSWVKSGGAIKFLECDLPDALGQTISFGLAVETSFDKVPKFIQNLLHPTQSPKIVVNICAMRVFAATQNALTVEHVEKYEADPAPNVAEIKAKMEKTVKPVNATIWLTCQVIDFDPGKLPGFAK